MVASQGNTTVTVITEVPKVHTIDVTGLNPGEYFISLKDFHYTWQGETTIKYLVDKDGLLHINGKIVGVNLFENPRVKIANPSDIQTVVIHPTQASMLKQFPNLNVVKLSEAQSISDSDMAHIGSITSLLMLDLTGVNMASSKYEHIKGLTELRRLDIGGSNVKDSVFKYFSDMIKLKWFYFKGSRYPSGKKVTGISDTALYNIGRLTNLESLNLTGYRAITDKGISRLQNLTHLKSLYLEGTSITDDGLQHLLNMSDLHELDLRRTVITDDGIKRLSGLKNLRKLSLGKSSGLGLPFLTQVNKYPNFKLRNEPRWQKLMKSLAALDKKEISTQYITARGLRYLRYYFKNLEELTLRAIMITRAGFNHLLNLTHLKVLRLTEIEMSKKKIERLEKALPNCEVKINNPNLEFSPKP